MAKAAVGDKPSSVKFISEKSPDYRLEFVNGAFGNLTPRGEIICNFHLEFRDIPTEQSAVIGEDGSVTFSPFKEAPSFTREVKFGVIMNVTFAKNLVQLLNDKIKEIESNFGEISEKG
jgi:hypothetical protein